MRWVVTGSRGQLGRALVEELRAEVAAAPEHSELDIGDAEAVDSFFDALPVPPDVVVNAAAFTHVDRCESEPERADRVNALGPGHLARTCRRIGASLVHVSTDYVFAGDSPRPYTEEDAPDPRSVYGRSKLEGERRVQAVSDAFLVVRTSWVFGRGRNFLGAILGQLEARRNGSASGPLRVVDDQRGRPTYAVDLARAIQTLVGAGARGLVHVANDGVATWWDLARACLDESGGRDVAIERIRTRDLDLPAPRPAHSVLDCGKARALGVSPRSWRDAVRAHLRAEASSGP